VAVKQGGNRSYECGVRSAECGEESKKPNTCAGGGQNLGDAKGAHLAGGLVRRAPLTAVQSAECRIRYYKSTTEGRRHKGTEARRHGGTEARRDEGPARGGQAEGRGDCQNGRRRPTAGNRDSGIGNEERAKSHGTWNLELPLRGK
jgi:hypothetical protein